MGNIDRAEWHYGGNFPADVPSVNGGTHIGMYLAWIVNHGLGSRTLQKYAGPSLTLLRERKITGRQLLFSELDEKFSGSLLTKVGKDFTRDYYETQSYFADYAAVLARDLPTAYHVEDSWENYDKIAAKVDERFARWLEGEKPPPSPEAAAQKQAEERYLDAILEASRRLPSDPAAAAAVLENYLSGDPVEPYRRMAGRELAIVRAKYGLGKPIA